MAIRIPDTSANIKVPISDGTATGKMWAANAFKTFSLFLWFRPDAVPVTSNHNEVLVLLDGSNQRIFSIGWSTSLNRWFCYINSTFAFYIPANSTEAIQAGKWTLLGVKFSTTEAMAWVYQEGSAGVISSPMGPNGTPAKPVSVILGNTPTGGVIGACVLGPMIMVDHAIDATDVANVYADGILGAYTNAAHSMTGPSGAFFGVGIQTDMINVGIGQVNPYPLAVLDNTGIPILDTGNATAPTYLSWPRPITKNASPIWVSHDWPLYTSAAVTPAVNNSSYAPFYAGMGGQKAARLANNKPSGLVRVICRGQSWCNIESKNETESYTGHLPAGMMAERLENCAGMDNLPLIRVGYSSAAGSGVFNTGILPYDVKTTQLYESDTTGALAVSLDHISTNSWSNQADVIGTLSRYNRGSSVGAAGCGHAAGIVTGRRLRLLAASSFGLVQTHNPLNHKFVYLNMPGGPRFRYRNVRDTRQSTPTANAVIGAWSSYIASATETVYTCNYTDQAYDAEGSETYTLDGLELTSTTASLVVSGTTTGVTAGMMARKGQYDVANVRSVTTGGGNTTITFDHPFGVTPTNGDVILFGEWSIGVLNITSDALPGFGDIANMRGYEIEVDTTTDGSTTANYLINMGVGCWATGVDGWIFIPDGKGGTSFVNQREKTNRTANANGSPEDQFEALLAGDLVFLMNAGDNDHGAGDDDTTLPAMKAYYARTRPTAEIVLGVNSFATTQYGTYRTAAAALGLPYISAMSLQDQTNLRTLRFEIAGSIHLSSFGSQREARTLLSNLVLATPTVASSGGSGGGGTGVAAYPPAG